MAWISYTLLLHCVFILKVAKPLYFLKFPESPYHLNFSYHHIAHSKSCHLWCAWPNSALYNLKVSSRIWDLSCLFNKGWLETDRLKEHSEVTFNKRNEGKFWTKTIVWRRMREKDLSEWSGWLQWSWHAFQIDQPNLPNQSYFQFMSCLHISKSGFQWSNFSVTSWASFTRSAPKGFHEQASLICLSLNLPSPYSAREGFHQ